MIKRHVKYRVNFNPNNSLAAREVLSALSREEVRDFGAIRSYQWEMGALESRVATVRKVLAQLVAQGYVVKVPNQDAYRLSRKVDI